VNRPRLAAAFLRLARRDLDGARLLLPSAPMLAAYHLQQAAEKLAKAALAGAGGAPVPKIHDIGRLVALMPPDHPWLAALAALADLTAYAAAARYPAGDELEPDPDPDELRRRADEIEVLLREAEEGA
jgi:HEPN domain-containing protein